MANLGLRSDVTSNTVLLHIRFRIKLCSSPICFELCRSSTVLMERKGLQHAGLKETSPDSHLV